MTCLKDELKNWTDELDNFKASEWDSLPDIYLYMDQVITWLERQLDISPTLEDEKMITPSMINNYVKNRVIPKPEKKKYGREHLTYLMLVLSLKQVLSLTDITWLISNVIRDTSVDILYDKLNDMKTESFKQVSSRVLDQLKHMDDKSGEEEVEKSLSNLALKLALEANAYRHAARKILNTLMERRVEEQENKAESEGSKKKEGSRKKNKSK